jgi:putative PIN family toxin of toxin-antitoxin system
MLKKNKLIIDTNLWISWFIGNKKTSLNRILIDETIQILSCDDQIHELFEVIERTKFRKYFLNDDLAEFKLLFIDAVTFIDVKIKVKVSRDPNDDYLLALAKAAKANYLLTGDKDLLVLKKFENTSINTLTEFLTQ